MPEFSEGLSIVIPTYNERENIEQLLAEIASVSVQLNRPSEVVLVDDRSPDGTAELASGFGRAGRPVQPRHPFHRVIWNRRSERSGGSTYDPEVAARRGR